MYYIVVLSSARPQVPSYSTGCSFIWPWRAPQQFQTKCHLETWHIVHATDSMQQETMSTDSAWTLMPSVPEVRAESRERQCRYSMHSAYQETKKTAAWRSICQNINFIQNKSSVLSISFHFKQFYSSTPGHYLQHTTRNAYQILARCHHPPDKIDELKIGSPASTKIYQSIQRWFSFHSLSA